MYVRTKNPSLPQRQEGNTGGLEARGGLRKMGNITEKKTENRKQRTRAAKRGGSSSALRCPPSCAPPFLNSVFRNDLLPIQAFVPHKARPKAASPLERKSLSSTSHSVASPRGVRDALSHRSACIADCRGVKHHPARASADDAAAGEEEEEEEYYGQIHPDGGACGLILTRPRRCCTSLGGPLQRQG